MIDITINEILKIFIILIATWTIVSGIIFYSGLWIDLEEKFRCKLKINSDLKAYVISILLFPGQITFIVYVFFTIFLYLLKDKFIKGYKSGEV